MADLPILFSGSMVRAILREIELPGTGKTQTRRVLDAWCDEPPAFVEDGTITAFNENYQSYRWPRTNAVGDRLYVREACRVSRMHDKTAPRDLKPRTMTVFFEAGGSIANQDAPGDWKPAVWPEIGERPEWTGKYRQAMHMPRWASRITLEVTGVKVERLQDCSDADAIAEGIEDYSGIDANCCGYLNYANNSEDGYWLPPVQSYRSLWDSINGPGAWAKNPWVAAYTFRPILGNIDQIARAA